MLPRLQDLKPVRPCSRYRQRGPKSNSPALAKIARVARLPKLRKSSVREFAFNFKTLRMARGLLF
jgi:hypothetical protein